MIDYLSIVETDKVNHAMETDMVKLVVEIESFGMCADEMDKETGSSDGLQLKQVDLSCVHALNEPHLHEIHVISNKHEADQLTWQDVKQQEDPQLVFVSFLAPVLSPDNQRNNQVSQDHLQKLNIGLLQIVHSRSSQTHLQHPKSNKATAKRNLDQCGVAYQGYRRTLTTTEGRSVCEYERFRAIGNESIHDYFVRFHKLVNDMKITQLNIPTHQMNTKFVNNLLAYWGKYVTNVKQNMDISTTPYVQIYTHLKAYEPHAKKTLKKQEQSTIIVDPLAYVAHTTSAPALSSPSTPSPQPTAQSPNDALMATMTQIANLLSGFQKQFPPTNNQLRTSSNSRTHATVHDGHIVTEPVQRKAPGN
ncbi:hypothetical protein Tco_0456135, partial [Tanacetum coccineum]